MFSFHPDKSPGPDGFQPFFFQAFWDIIKLDVIAAIKFFFETSEMPTSWKQTYIALVPKVSNPSLAHHFRPISLTNTIYKIAAKILANRMSKLMPSLVSSSQSAFIPGRNIIDNILLAQELMHSLHRAPPSRSLMLLKIDMEKAFDRFQWGYLTQLLHAFNFNDKFISWVLACISHPQFALLINGSPSDWFPISCGLRQGCPLSPYLFILGSELLSTYLHGAIQLKLLRAYKPSPQGPVISHILYADDCLLTARATVCDALMLKSILEAYCDTTGQAINYSKSHIIFSPILPLLLRSRFSISFKLQLSVVFGITWASHYLLLL